jgi:hypothetical protein
MSDIPFLESEYKQYDNVVKLFAHPLLDGLSLYLSFPLLEVHLALDDVHITVPPAR